jgi:hypothetical protein
MRSIQQDMPHFMVPREDHRYFRRRLQDEQSTPEQHVESWNASSLT